MGKIKDYLFGKEEQPAPHVEVGVTQYKRAIRENYVDAKQELDEVARRYGEARFRLKEKIKSGTDESKYRGLAEKVAYLGIQRKQLSEEVDTLKNDMPTIRDRKQVRRRAHNHGTIKKAIEEESERVSEEEKEGFAETIEVIERYQGVQTEKARNTAYGQEIAGTGMLSDEQQTIVAELKLEIEREASATKPLEDRIKKEMQVLQPVD